MDTSEAISRERTRLVLADDARHLLELERSFFPESEFEVTLARNGCEAYNFVKTLEPAVVFLDLFMPLINGEECCRLIKSDLHLNATRVVLVAPDDEQQRQRCFAAQCDLVVSKPVRRRDFLGAVQTLVGRLYRLPARWPVRVDAELYDDGRLCLRSWTVNLSEKGAYLESAQMLPMGRKYTLRLSAGDEEPIILSARIAWHNSGDAPRDRRLPPGFGLQFLHLAGESRGRLHALLGAPAPADAVPLNSRRAGERMFIELPMLTGRRL